jgi:ABC-type uncharacterized transport system ATPase subunit
VLASGTVGDVMNSRMVQEVYLGAAATKTFKGRAHA